MDDNSNYLKNLIILNFIAETSGLAAIIDKKDPTILGDIRQWSNVNPTLINNKVERIRKILNNK